MVLLTYCVVIRGRKFPDFSAHMNQMEPRAVARSFPTLSSGQLAWHAMLCQIRAEFEGQYGWHKTHVAPEPHSPDCMKYVLMPS